MNRNPLPSRAITILLTLLALSGIPLLAKAEAAGEKDFFSGSVDAGIRTTTIDGDREKFMEYRDIDSGFFLEDFNLKYDRPGSSTYFDLSIKNLDREDEFFGIKGGRYGSYRYRLFYDSIPHTYGTGKSLFSGFGTDYLSIPDPVQSELQSSELTRAARGSNPLAPAPLDTAQQNTVRGLFGSADEQTFKVVRKKSGFWYEQDLPNDVKTWLKLSSEKREGTNPISTGTYERFPQAGLISGTTATHTADFFFVSGAELAEPIDYVTTMISAGAGVYKKTWLADLEYSFTDFKNEFSALRWDNPFRISDATATSATDAAVTPANNAFNRGRFAAGQLALPPDSESHDFNVSGSAALPMDGRLSVNIGYGWITQEEAFLPYTLNSAVAGVAGAPADITNPAILPARDLAGEVKTLSGSTALTFKPADALLVTAKYRYYQYDDKSSRIQFPGYVAFGESYWRTKRNDPGTDNVRNEPFSFTKQAADLSFDYHLSRPLTLMLETGWEAWDYEELRLDSSDEYSIGAGVLYKPSRASSLKVAYTFADKDVDGYKTGNTAANPEAVGLVNYNWADRERNKVEARYQVLLRDTVTAGLSGRYYEDDYAEDDRLGLKEVKDYVAGVNVAYSPSGAFTVSTMYTREYRKDFIRNGAKDDSFNVTASTLDDPFTADAFNPFNYWNTEIENTIDTVGIDVTFPLITGKLDFSTGYNFSYGKMKFTNDNPNAAEARAATGQDAKLANAITEDWPDVKNRLHEIRASLTYAVTQNLSASLRYLYEWYTLTDFTWDQMDNYLAGSTDENSTRFVFMNPTYRKYEAQVASVNMIYRF